MRRSRTSLLVASLLVATAFAGSAGSRTVHADTTTNAIATMTNSDLSVGCSFSLDLSLPCVATFTADVQ